MNELYVGLISGTSVDAVDAALVAIDEDRFQILATHSEAYPEATANDIQALVRSPGTINIDDLGELDTEVGELFAVATKRLLEQAGTEASAVRAIGSHGQTVRHHPDGNSPFSLQIGDPNIIACRTGITTVADFRRRDIALGGQGAPLVPAFHAATFRDPAELRVVLNIGGIANITVLPGDGQVFGFDTGPGNCLMDIWIERKQEKAYDADGEWAASGTAESDLVAQMLGDRYFRRIPPKSTGREHFNYRWLETALNEASTRPEPVDVQASLLELSARSIAEAIERHASDCKRVLACGGGVHNTALMARLAALLPACDIQTTAAYGIDPDWVEAVAFAWLARRTIHSLPGNLPAVTGARRPCILGGVFIGESAGSS